MGKSFFITGTDTGVGKTLVACALLQAAKRQGLSTAAIKPVAAGCQRTAQGLRNDDAMKLLQAATCELPYEQVNPVALEPAIAPHIAAANANKSVTAARLAGFCRGVMMQPCDMVLVEGAGGWRVPLNPREYLSDVARELNIAVIIVVGMRLGCINHALLTAQAVAADGLKVAGWVANGITADMPYCQENLDAIKQRLPYPCIGQIPYFPQVSASEAADYLNIQNLFD